MHSILSRPVLHFLFVLSLIYCVNCGSFNNTEVEITPKNGKTFKVNLTGSVERRKFEDSVQVIRVKVEDQPLPYLKVGTVQNLIKATAVEFINTSTEVVEARTFRNLPALKTIFLTYSQIKTIPVGVFHGLPALSKIRVNNNKINTIEDGAFGNIPALSLLYVGGNQVQVWNSNWFTNSTALEEIDFRYNLLQKIPTNAFPGLNHLKRIFLDYNDISKIEPDAFRGLKHLETLGLAFNRLTTIEPNVFPSKVSIEALHIKSNKINFLSNELLDKISVKEIALDGNPWKCPCIDQTMLRLQQDNVVILNSDRCWHSRIPVCVVAKGEDDICSTTVSESDTEMYFSEVKKAIGKDISKYFRCFRFD